MPAISKPNKTVKDKKPIKKVEKVKTGKRGRPSAADQEKLYTLRASDGCTIKTGVNPKFVYMTCEHHLEMKYVK